MNYLDELWEKYFAGDELFKETIISIITEALEKQRELSCIAINDDQEHTYYEYRNIILNTKLEEQDNERD